MQEPHHEQSTRPPRRSGIGAWRRGAITVAVASMLSAGSGVMLARANVADTPPINPPAVQAPQKSFADLVQTVQPAVVSIVVEGHMSAAENQGPQFQMPDDPRFRDFFQHFFGQQMPQDDGNAPDVRVRAAGSGFIVDPDGYIVTNNHVTKGANDITVVLNDGTKLSATLKGSDPKTDLALLKVDTDKPLPWVKFGDSEKVRPGDWVVAIGNPFGLGGTVTTGIVSARGRDIHSGPYDDYLQIDAAINSGNSGGPLFDTSGNVIGVNTAIYTPNGGNVGIGFAIPSDQAQTVVQALKQNGHVERGFLGVQIQTVTKELAESLDLPKDKGALVAEVTPDSPAAHAGIEVGDVIVGFNGKAIDEMRELPRLVAATDPGESATVKILRDGKSRQLKVTVAPYKESVAQADTGSASDGAHLGVAVAALNDESRSRFDIPKDVQGTVIVNVEPGSPAARVGLRPGDVIRKADGHNVESPKDLVGALKKDAAKDRKQVVLLVNRAGSQWFVPVPLA